jgi:hypothetical protein
VPASAPSGFAATRFDEGFVALRLATGGREPTDTRVHDALGLASGALAFDLALEPGATAERIVECPPAHSSIAIGEPAFDWAKELPAAQWSGSGWAMDAIRAALTAMTDPDPDKRPQRARDVVALLAPFQERRAALVGQRDLARDVLSYFNEPHPEDDDQ